MLADRARTLPTPPYPARTRGVNAPALHRCSLTRDMALLSRCVNAGRSKMTPYPPLASALADIYVPGNATKPPGGFPVLLFLFGGLFSMGGASFPLYDGDSDVTLTEDVILVAANYRLNVFGWLAGDELRAESADGSVGNYGLQVRCVALRCDARWCAVALRCLRVLHAACRRCWVEVLQSPATQTRKDAAW